MIRISIAHSLSCVYVIASVSVLQLLLLLFFLLSSSLRIFSIRENSNLIKILTKRHVIRSFYEPIILLSDNILLDVWAARKFNIKCTMVWKSLLCTHTVYVLETYKWSFFRTNKRQLQANQAFGTRRKKAMDETWHLVLFRLLQLDWERDVFEIRNLVRFASGLNFILS